MNRRSVIKTFPFLGMSLVGFSRLSVSGEGKSESLCLEYLNHMTKLLEKIRDTQEENLLKASENIARTYKSGGKCFCQWETGHSFDGDMFPDRPGDTDLFIMGYTMGTPPVQPKKGDLLLINVLRKPMDEDIDKQGFFIIGGPNSWCGDIEHSEQLTEENQKLLVRKYSNIWIDTYINLYSSLIYLPGETVPIGPTSGALNMATYWAMTADAVRLLAAEGVSVKVKGDGPHLPQNTPRVNLKQPLASAYINEAIREIRLIKTEMDTLNRIAGEAADHILSGGKLYVYSRYREALSAEANAKRGGLALLNTTFADDPDFKGNEKDYMIMGVYRTDYSVDMRMLKKFRESGMKISSIGPSTINGKKPSGKTIADETDFHLGGFDTGGFFAMPGLDKKVCPTSGIIITLTFWATMIQLAEEIIRRTGNTPGVLSSGAFKGGAEQRENRLEMVKKRGY
jgi:uncharacterized phosphosugar-binding protein